MSESKEQVPAEFGVLGVGADGPIVVQAKTRKRAPAGASLSDADLASMSPDELQKWADDEFDTAPELIDPPTPRRLDASISVRFSSAELEELRQLAEHADMKVTAFIRAVVLQHAGGAQVIDVPAVQRLAQELVELTATR